MSVAGGEKQSCLFGQECRMLRAPEAELKICQHCSRAFHHVCAAENRGSDDVNYCGDCRREELVNSCDPIPPASTAVPGQNATRSGSSLLDIFIDLDAPGPSQVDRNVQKFENLEDQDKGERTQRLYAYRLRRMIDFFKADKNYHAALNDSQDNLKAPLPSHAILAFFGDLAQQPGRAKRKREPLVRREAGAGPQAAEEEAEMGDSEEEEVMEVDEASNELAEGTRVVQAQSEPFDPNTVPTVSPSTIQGYKSALRYFYARRGLDFDSEYMPQSKVSINLKLRRVIHAYTKTVVKKKAAGIMDLQEGRTGISVPEYRELTRIMREM
eukprot:638587-Hanusia_phi.AAC.1